MKTAKFGFEINNQYWTTTYGSYWIPDINYDKKGSITSLQRDGNGTSLQDNLTYSYTTGTNRLASLSGTSPTTYTYDDNGNVIGDTHKGILFAIYDADNLPVRIYKSNGESQFYTYDMNGNRTRKTVNGSIDRFYFNGIDGKTEAVCLLPYSSDLTYNIWGNEDNIGQVKVVNNYVTGRYYYLKDHLSSIKMTVKGGQTLLSDNFNTDSQWTTVQGIFSVSAKLKTENLILEKFESIITVEFRVRLISFIVNK